MTSKKDPRDIWRLSDELNVIDAAILIIGENPSEKKAGYEDGVLRQKTNYDDFDAAFKSLRNAIFKNKLQATISYSARNELLIETPYFAGDEMQYSFDPIHKDEEIEIKYDQLIRAHNKDSNALCSDPELVLKNSKKIWLIREPNWLETTIDVDELKDWLRTRNYYPEFFFPDGSEQSYKNKDNPRYSPKLATAIAAWENVVTQMPNKSVKESLASWVQANGVNFDLADETGTVAKQAIEQVATVANWNTKGGATPTGGQVESTSKTDIQNFYKTPNFDTDLDDEIPF